MPTERGSFNHHMARVALSKLADEHGVSLEDIPGRRQQRSRAGKAVERVIDGFLTQVSSPLGLTKSDSARILGVNRGTVYNRSRRLGLF